MPIDSKKLSDKPAFLAILAGIFVFLSFERFNLVPFVLLFPCAASALVRQVKSTKQAFWYGFLTSFVVMLGGFYWVTYVIHEFGYLPWSVSALLFLGFCGFGALNFPLFLALAYGIQRRWGSRHPSAKSLAIWHLIGLPALFTVVEWLIPKLFPWYLGHCLYRLPLLIQLSDTTGTTFLTFSLFSLGGLITLWRQESTRRLVVSWSVIPLTLWGLQIAYGSYRLQEPLPQNKIRVALIQPNIGSLEKIEAEQGLGNRIRFVLDRYQTLTRKAVAAQPKPDLILWPETAMPFQLDRPGNLATEIRSFIQEIGVPVITGAYAQSPYNAGRDFNAGFLLEPTASGIQSQVYWKNILLAFGEYFPFGESYPKLYELFPQVSDFERGKYPGVFNFKDKRLGITICYEAIVPSFFRKTALEGVHAMINLTNDSWFGPTAEPYLHASLTIFRAIEHRVPFARVTNTGISFSVDAWGRRSDITPSFEPAILVTDLAVDDAIHETFYLKWGDWFIAVALVLLGLSILTLRRNHASLSH